jgi:progesterone-induced-blocking factor 1
LKKRELLHTIELLKLELSQKNLLIDTLKQEHETTVLELEEKLNDVHHEKVMYSTQLALLKRGFEEEIRKLQQKSQKDVERLNRQICDFEEFQLKSSQQNEDIKLSLQAPLMTEGKYRVLRAKQVEDLTVEEHVLMRYYELCQEHIQRSAKLESETQQLREDNRDKEGELNHLEQDLRSLRSHKEELELECQQLKQQVKRVGQHVQDGNVKIDMFDQMKGERDSLLHEKSLLTSHLSELEQNLKHYRDEYGTIRSDLSSSEQKVSLLTHDKDYLTKQLAEVTKRCHVAEEKAQFLEGTLEVTKKAREELYEKLLNAKELHRTEFQDKLQDEIESLRARTGTEVEQLKRQAREIYERENRALMEAKDAAQLERDRALQGEKDALKKYEDLLNTYRQLQVQSDSHVSELQSDNKLKSFEFERLQLVHDETKRNLKSSELEKEKLTKKVEVLTEELYVMRSDHQRTVHELEGRVREQSSRLDVFEKLEKELDDVVLQAAEIEDESSAEKVLVTFGYGSNLPTTSKRRLQQSVQLARRVLQLERANSSLKKQLETESDNLKQVQEELSKSRNLVKLAQQPYHYLLDGMQSRDEQIQAQKRALDELGKKVAQCQEERKMLIQQKNELSADLEKLLAHREELAVMRQVVVGLMTNRPSVSPSKVPPKGGHGRVGTARRVATDDSQVSIQLPAPIVFTRQPPPHWYRQVKMNPS